MLFLLAYKNPKLPKYFYAIICYFMLRNNVYITLHCFNFHHIQEYKSPIDASMNGLELGCKFGTDEPRFNVTRSVVLDIHCKLNICFQSKMESDKINMFIVT